jgi:hypothetical protein
VQALSRALTAVVALLLLAAAPAARAAGVLREERTGTCVLTSASGYAPVRTASDAFDMFATRRTAAVAQRLVTVIRTNRIFETYDRVLRVGSYVPRLLVGERSGRPGPLPIFVAPHTDALFHGTDVLGITAPICRPPDGYEPLRDAVVVPDDLEHIGSPPSNVADETLAHEIFHAYLQGVAGRDDYAVSWLDEAAAEWASRTYFHIAYPSNDDFDQAFLGHPEMPLDTFAGHTDTQRRHPYGAWRFLAYVASQERRPGPLISLLIQVFQAAGRDPTTANATATFIDHFPAGLTVVGRSGGADGFAQALTDFWGLRLSRFQHPSGIPVPIQQHHTLRAGATSTWTLAAAPLSAATFEVRLPVGDPVTLRVDAPADGGIALYGSGDAGYLSGLGPFAQIGGPQSDTTLEDCARGPGITDRVVFVNTGSHRETADLQWIAAGAGSSC